PSSMNTCVSPSLTCLFSVSSSDPCGSHCWGLPLRSLRHCARRLQAGIVFIAWAVARTDIFWPKQNEAYKAAEKSGVAIFFFLACIVRDIDGLIAGVSLPFQSNPMLQETHFRPNLSSKNGSTQISHAHQIVGSTGEGKEPVHSTDSTMT